MFRVYLNRLNLSVDTPIIEHRLMKTLFSIFQQNNQPLLSGHDRRANDQQEEPDAVQEAREPNPGALVRPSDRVQHREHRRPRSDERLAPPCARPPLADHSNRPVQPDHPRELSRPGHSVARRGADRGPPQTLPRVDPPQMGEPSLGERRYSEKVSQFPIGHHRLGDLHLPHQADRAQHGWRHSRSYDGAQPHLPRRDYAATGGQARLPKFRDAERRGKRHIQAESRVRRQHVQQLPGAGQAGEQHRAGIAGGDQGGEDLSKLDELDGRGPPRELALL